MNVLIDTLFERWTHEDGSKPFLICPDDTDHTIITRDAFQAQINQPVMPFMLLVSRQATESLFRLKNQRKPSRYILLLSKSVRFSAAQHRLYHHRAHLFY